MSCPSCGGQHCNALGRLGFLLWLRCRDCGADHEVDTRDVPEEVDG